jgi:hypothetical protein
LGFSSSFRLFPLGAAKPRIDDVVVISRVVGAAFDQRRMTLRYALSTQCDAPALEAASFDPATRGETLAGELWPTDRSLARTWRVHDRLETPNENGLPEGKPLFYLIAGARFELATFRL